MHLKLIHRLYLYFIFRTKYKSKLWAVYSEKLGPRLRWHVYYKEYNLSIKNTPYCNKLFDKTRSLALIDNDTHKS